MDVSTMSTHELRRAAQELERREVSVMRSNLTSETAKAKATERECTAESAGAGAYDGKAVGGAGASSDYGLLGRPRPHVMALTLDNVDEAFRYHPWGPLETAAGDVVREALVAAVKAVLRSVPDSPDRSSGLRKLREARMDFNSAITHEGRF